MTTPITVESVLTNITALTAAITRQSDIQERLLAGQEAALAKLEGAKPARTPRAAKVTETAAPAAAEEPAPKEEPAAAVETQSFLPDVSSLEKFEAFCKGWVVAAADAEAKKDRVAFAKAVADNFGVEAKFPAMFPHAEQVAFYFLRKAEGCKVDFNAEYDFTGDPAQGDGEPEGGDSDFG